MRTRIAAAAVTAAALTTLTACSSGSGSTVKSAPDKPAATTAAARPTTAAPTTTTAAPAPTAAAVGDTITVSGDEGVKLAITLKKWNNTARSTDQYFTPEPGKTWVAGQFEIRNVGTAVYDDSPGNCVQAADAQGQRFDEALLDAITAGPLMPSELKLPPGDVALGWLVFQVPKPAAVTRVQYTPNSGFAEETAQWTTK
ncbi:DUF4352 domain-containing protein [Streptomyces sp. NRRL F-5123]|uniref:DUF4352 domain-containing protein n=1 Tax=Streptomyces sp. NRRL F-5123 TaxID=1463856 RepID=UPI0004E1BF29|nr:DUF4352 domain-containing protein [Streptomyces sp. NRRL F-5123]